MAFPSVTSVTATALGAGPGPFDVPMPATVAANDLLLMVYGVGYSDTAATPSGWTGKFTTAATNRRLACFVKKAAGTEGGTNVSTGHSNDGQASAHVYRIAASSWSQDLDDVEVGTSATGTDENPDPPSVTSAGGSADNLFIELVAYEAAFNSVSAYSTSYTNGSATKSVAEDTGNEIAVATARREYASASDNPGTLTLAGAPVVWIANTVVIRPAAASPKGLIMLMGDGGFL